MFDAVETLCESQMLDCGNGKFSLKGLCEEMHDFMPSMCYVECVCLANVDPFSICLLQFDFIFFLTVS